MCNDDVNHKEIEVGAVTDVITQIADCTKPELTTYTVTFTNTAFSAQTKENVETKATLAHNYTYALSANEKTITENCDKGCGHSATATISAPTGTLVYDGNAKTATVDYSSNWKGGELSITYTKDGVASTDTKGVGNYVASITLGGKTASVTYTVQKAKITKPTADNTTFTYNGEAQTYTIAANDNYTVSGNVQTNAGNYDVTVSLNDTANYEWADSSITDLTFEFNIAKKSISGATITLGEALTYNGSEQTQAVSNVVIDGLNVTYDISGNTATDVKTDGDYTLTITGKGNFTGTANKAWNIAKANAEITVDTTPIVKTYGDVWTLPVATTSFGTVVCDKVITDLANAGTYTVTYSVAGTDNYNGDTKQISVTVTQATPTITPPTASRVIKGSTLSASILTGGAAKGVDGITDITGDFTWKDGAEVLNTNGIVQKTVVFAPESTFANYKAVELLVDVEVDLSSGGGGSIPRYTVKFDTDGGSSIKSVSIIRNNRLTEPYVPTKDGYVFDGWYTDKELTEKYDFTSRVTKSFTLYAKWEIDEKQSQPVEPDIDPTEWKNPFVDVGTNDWFYDVVKEGCLSGLIKGTSEKAFSPDGDITRGMFVTILYRAEGEPAVNKSIPFADVKATDYYANAVIWAQQNEIIKGISETEFAPDENITREQMAAILFRYAQYKGMDAVNMAENLEQFTDGDKISEYAVSALNWAVGAGIISGKGNGILDPIGNATRAEATTVLVRFIDIIE